MSRPPNATQIAPDGTVTHPYLNAQGYSTARRLLDVGDQAWGKTITEKLVDEDGEVVLVLSDGTILELNLP